MVDMKLESEGLVVEMVISFNGKGGLSFKVLDIVAISFPLLSWA